MISHKYKCIFIHIPKTAGTSIENKLEHFEHLEYGIQDRKTIRHIEPVSLMQLLPTNIEKEKKCYDEHYNKLFKKYLKQKLWFYPQYIPNQQYNKYFEFSFVLNLWSKVLSWYQNITRDSYQQQNTGELNTCSFKEFVSNHLDRYFLNSQLSWLLNCENTIPLDFIDRFENLSDDFAYICDRLEIKDISLPKLLISKQNNGNYTNFYDSEMKQKVAKKYQEKIDLFKFTFGK